MQFSTIKCFYLSIFLNTKNKYCLIKEVFMMLIEWNSNDLEVYMLF